MKKSDLKTGMWVVCKNEAKGIIMLDTKDGDIISGDTLWCSLESYDEDLRADLISDFDIVKILQPKCPQDYFNFHIDQEDNYKVIWQREESDLCPECSIFCEERFTDGICK